MPWAAAAAVAGAVIGGVVQSKSASKAAKATGEAADTQTAELRAGREAAAKLAAPFVELGTGAAGQLQSFLQDPHQRVDDIDRLAF